MENEMLSAYFNNAQMPCSEMEVKSGEGQSGGYAEE